MKKDVARVEESLKKDIADMKKDVTKEMKDLKDSFMNLIRHELQEMKKALVH